VKTLTITILATIALALAACGGSDTTTTVQAPAPEAATTTTAPADPALPTGWTEQGFQTWLSVCKGPESTCVCIAQELANRGVTDADIIASAKPSAEFRSELAAAVIACDAPSY